MRRRFVLVLACLVFGVPLAPVSAAGPPSERVTCGQPIDHNLRVANNLEDCPGHGLVVDAADIIIDLGGHRIDGTGGAGEYGVDNSAGHDGVLVRNGFVDGFDTAVFLSGAERNTLSRLQVSGCNTGIALLLGAGNKVAGNSASANGAGIYLDSSAGNKLVRNKVTANSSGIVLLGPSDNTVIRDNQITGTSSDGIFIGPSEGVVLRGNVTSANGANGIRLSGSARTSIRDGRSNANDLDGLSVAAATQTVAKDNVLSENGRHGLASDSADVKLVGNVAKRNGFIGGGLGDDVGLGISVPTGTINSRNVARGNDDPNQCEAADVNCFVP
jgi:parallel beta-helix repeat protein